MSSGICTTYDGVTHEQLQIAMAMHATNVDCYDHEMTTRLRLLTWQQLGSTMIPCLHNI